MKKRNFIIVIIVLIATINITLNMRIGNEFCGLASLKIEALASDEGSASGRGPLYKSGCIVIERVIMGYHSDGSPNIVEVGYDGEQGDCAGLSGDCPPYGCTRYY